METITLTRSSKTRKGHNTVIFESPQLRGLLIFNNSAFPLGAIPEHLQLTGPEFAKGPFTRSAPKPKLTKEERAAARAAETPAEKLAKADAKIERAQRQRERLAKVLADAAATSPALQPA